MTTAVIGAACVGPLAGAAPMSTGKRNIKKALKYGMIGGGGGKEGEKLSVLDRFKMAADAGFDGIELDSPNNLDTDEVLKARDATGMTIPGVVDSVHWQHTLADPDPAVRMRGLHGLEQALRDCKAYGGTSALLVPAVVNKHISYADAYTRSQAEIRKALPLAKELGVKIAFENVWNGFLLSPLEAVRYVDEFESDRVGWHLDIGNIVNFGWPEQWVRILGTRILKLDAKGFSRTKRDKEGLWKGFGVEIGDGDCDWPAVMKALDEIGYEGWMAAEVSGGGPERLKEIADRMDRVLGS
jgi:hexulose-6-phosphate isomerase